MESLLPNTLQNFTLVGYSFNGGEKLNNELWTFRKLEEKIGETYYNFNPVGFYSSFIFYFELSRKPSYFLITIVLPAVLLQVLQIAAVLLPFDCEERPAYSITVMLSLSVLLTSITQEIPKTSQTVLLVLNVSIQVVFGAICIVYSLISFNFTKYPQLLKPIDRTGIKISRARFIDVTFYLILTLIAFSTNAFVFNEMLSI